MYDEDDAIPRDHPDYDRLFKVRKLLDLFTPLLRKLYRPKQNICIDESMIPFKGRVMFRQYIPSKRTRFGIKAWVLAESDTGYVSEFSIYTGKSLDNQPTVDLAATVVKGLTESYHNLGYHLYLDNYYTKVNLLEYLFDKGIYACGTCLIDRSGFPQGIVEKSKRKFPRGSIDWRMEKNILAVTWLDNKPVNFLTTIHKSDYDKDTPIEKRTVKRKGKKGSEAVTVECPPCVQDYNQWMGGVDFADKLMKYYNCGRRSRKWPRRVFFHIVEIAAHNAYVLESCFVPHRKNGKKVSRSLLSFKQDLVEQLIDGFNSYKQSGRPPVAPQPVRKQDVGSHHPIFKEKPRNCAACSESCVERAGKSRKESGIRRSRLYCDKCNVYLCLDSTQNCWNSWHS